MLIYETLVREFEQSLLTRLRGHNQEAGFLQTWVPDSDPVKSLVYMIESAQAAGVTRFEIVLDHTTLSVSALGALNEQLVGVATLFAHLDESSIRLTVDNIGSAA